MRADADRRFGYAAIAEQRAEVERIAGESAESTFENTIAALERSVPPETVIDAQAIERKQSSTIFDVVKDAKDALAKNQPDAATKPQEKATDALKEA